MTLPFVAMLDLVLLTRLVLMSDAPLDARRAIPLMVVQSVGALLLLRFSIASASLAAALAALGGGLWVADRRLPRRVRPPICKVPRAEAARRPGAWYSVRLTFLLADGIALAAFLAPWSRSEIWPWLRETIRALPGYLVFPAITPASALHAGTLVMGALLVINEANLVVRAVLHTAGVEPESPSSEERAPVPAEIHSVRRGTRWPWSARQLAPVASPPTEKLPAASPTGAGEARQWDVGGIVGILERLLVLAVAMAGQYAAIAFIIAAKAFARRELERRSFAEYVLAGTLLSVLLALSVALLLHALGI